MIRRIVLKNFMSHEFTVIEPVAAATRANPNSIANSSSIANSKSGDNLASDSDADETGASQANGLTVLIGDNNSGKSAIVAALQTVAQNASGDFMVRHGEKECEVTIETCECGKCFDKNIPPQPKEAYRAVDGEPYVAECPRGNVLTWRRIKNKTSYVVNGRVVDRLRGGVPDDLHQWLRMPLVETPKDKKTFDIHFGEQKSPIFLLGERATDRAAFFASSSDTAKLIEMQQLHRAKIKEANSRRTLKCEEHSRLVKRLNTLESLDPMEESIKQIESQYDEIKTKQSQCLAIQEMIEALTTASSLRDRLEAVSHSLKAIQTVPEVQDTAPLSKVIHHLEAQQRRQRDAKSQLQVLASCQIIPQISPTDVLQELIQKLSRWSGTFAAAQRISQVLAKCEPLPQKEVFSKPAPELRKLIESLASAQASVENEKKKLVKHELEKAEAEAELRENFEQLDSCPTCGQPIDVETALATAHLSAEEVANDVTEELS